MRNRNLLSALLAIVAVFSIPVLTEAQAASLNICCNPVPGSNLIHISFIDPGIYAQFEVTVNAAPVMVLPPAAPSATITALVPVPGNGTHTICVRGTMGPTGAGPPSCCQVTLPLPKEFIRGDSNDDKTLNIADPIATLQMLFGSLPLTCDDAADANDDGAVDLADPIHMMSYLLNGGMAPPAPFPLCGLDPTLDGIDCLNVSLCP